MIGSLFFLCMCVCVFFLRVADEPWNGAPTICGLVWVSVSCGPASTGETRLLPHFSRSHVGLGPSDRLKTSVTCLYLAAVAAAARPQHCSCFPKCAGQSIIMRKDILIRAVSTWGRHAGMLSRGWGRGQKGVWSPSHLLLGLVIVSLHF